MTFPHHHKHFNYSDSFPIIKFFQWQYCTDCSLSRIASKTLSKEPYCQLLLQLYLTPVEPLYRLQQSLSLSHTERPFESCPPGLTCKLLQSFSNRQRTSHTITHSHCPLLALITVQVTVIDQWATLSTFTFSSQVSALIKNCHLPESLSDCSFRLLKMHHLTKLRFATRLLLDQVTPNLPQLTCFRSVSTATVGLPPGHKTHTSSCPFAEKSQPSFKGTSSSACPFSGALQHQDERKLYASEGESTGLPFNQIPTPPSLPIVGTLFDLILAGGAEYVHQYCDKRHKTLGPIYREKLGNVEAVFLSDAKLIQKVNFLFCLHLKLILFFLFVFAGI